MAATATATATATAAQRQATYRARRHNAGPAGNGERRLNTWQTTEAYVALARLAKGDNLTKRAALEPLITAADGKILATIEPGSPEWKAYFKRD